MAAAKKDILIEQGATFKRVLRFKVKGSNSYEDLTGEEFRGQVRSTATDNAIVATFTCTILDQVTNTGSVSIELTPIQTADIPVDENENYIKRSSKYVYDIERVFANGSIDRVLEGVATVTPQVTRDEQ